MVLSLRGHVARKRHAKDLCRMAVKREGNRMKQGIHPEYMETAVTCSCGSTFTTHSTVASIRVELCNQCHPFYTGKQKLVDTGGRVDRFNRRLQKADK